MLITNTPNSELHVYNNSGEEIVKIDESGVVKPDVSGGGLPPATNNTYLIGDGAAWRPVFRRFDFDIDNNNDIHQYQLNGYTSFTSLVEELIGTPYIEYVLNINKFNTETGMLGETVLCKPTVSIIAPHGSHMGEVLVKHSETDYVIISGGGDLPIVSVYGFGLD